MEIKVNTKTIDGSFVIFEDADIHDTMNVITGSLIAEGYDVQSIIEGYECQIKMLNKEIE